jgi:hypothetical protein
VCHNARGTFKQTAAYCPSCIEDDIASGRAPYIRLAWLIDEVKACARHRTKLVVKCPRCDVALKRDTRLPDHLVCTVCRISAVEQSAAHQLEEATYSEVWVAWAVRDLIAATHGGTGVLTRENLEEAVRFVTHNYFGGRLYNLERKLLLSPGTLRRWLLQPAKPQLTTVLRMFEAARVSPVDLLFTRNGSLEFGERNYRMEHYTARKHRPMTPERRTEVERRMRTALETPGVGQISRICKDLRTGAGTIQRYFPELYRSLRAKGLRELKIKHALAKESRLRRVMEGAQLLVCRGIYPSQRQLRRVCGVTASDLACEFVQSEYRAYLNSLSVIGLRAQ